MDDLCSSGHVQLAQALQTQRMNAVELTLSGVVMPSQKCQCDSTGYSTFIVLAVSVLGSLSAVQSSIIRSAEKRCWHLHVTVEYHDTVDVHRLE